MSPTLWYCLGALAVGAGLGLLVMSLAAARGMQMLEDRAHNVIDALARLALQHGAPAPLVQWHVDGWKFADRRPIDPPPGHVEPPRADDDTQVLLPYGVASSWPRGGKPTGR